MRVVLLLFEDVSGLKVNFNKSMLTGINISDSWLSEAALVMNCRRGTIPFIYLGLPIGGDPRKLSFWKPVVDRIVSRLSKWNNKFLSFGGRLVLLKSVLSSLPVYFLSFFKAPAGIISSIESIFKKKIWGGSEDHRKIAWINWETICTPKYARGLGVRWIGAFNLALLGKWCWRMLTDKKGLWYRVLKARYGEVGGRLQEGGRNTSSWWRMLARVREGVGEGVGRWFDDNTRRVIGDGRDTLFWYDTWVGELPLRVRYPRLFDLAVLKECMVEEMSRLGWGERRARVWRRRLLAWEEESVRECSVLLHNIVLQDEVNDTWRWLLDNSGGYTVKGAYTFITTTGEPLNRSPVLDVWHKQIPSKVSVFAWGLFQKRLPTKDNLMHMHVIQPENAVCALGCGQQETTNHLFLDCNIFSSLWYQVWHWLDISSTMPSDINHYYLQFTNMAGLPKGTHSFLRISWFASAWVLWKERNTCIFQNAVFSPASMLYKVKLYSFLWLKAGRANFNYCYHDWWQHPIPCMGPHL